MHSVKLEETIVLDVITSNTSGAATDADSTPTCKVFEDANDTPILTPTVTKRTGETGNYRVSVACTTANGFEPGKSYNVIELATLGGTQAKTVLATFQVRTYSIDDAVTRLDSVLSRLPAALVSGRMDAHAGALANDVITAAAIAADAIGASELASAAATKIANEVEAQIIDETDSEKVLTAITDKIAAVNPDLSGLTLGAIAAAVRDVSNASPAAGSLGERVNAVKAKTDSLTFTTSGRVDATAVAVSDKTGYSLAQAFPANFADLAISASTGRVTVGTNADKTGYSLAVTPPTAADVVSALNAATYAGRTFTNIVAALGSFSRGRTTVVDNGDGTSTVAFKDHDGTTTTYTVTFNTTTGARTAAT